MQELQESLTELIQNQRTLLNNQSAFLDKVYEKVVIDDKFQSFTTKFNNLSKEIQTMLSSGDFLNTGKYVNINNLKILFIANLELRPTKLISTTKTTGGLSVSFIHTIQYTYTLPFVGTFLTFQIEDIKTPLSFPIFEKITNTTKEFTKEITNKNPSINISSDEFKKTLTLLLIGV